MDDTSPGFGPGWTSGGETINAESHPKLFAVIESLPASGLDPPRGASPGRVDEHTELTYLRAGSDPPWERPHENGVDVTDDPGRQTPYQRQRRAEFDARVRAYREHGLIE